MEPLIIGLAVLYGWAILRAGNTPGWVYREVMKDSPPPFRKGECEEPTTSWAPAEPGNSNSVNKSARYPTVRTLTTVFSEEEQSEAAAALRRAVRKTRS